MNKSTSFEKVVLWALAAILINGALIGSFLTTQPVEAQVASGSALLKSVGSDLTIGTAPANTKHKFDNFALSSENPKLYTSQTGDVTHSFYGSYSSSYSVSVGTCRYPQGGTECQVTSFSNDFTIGVGANYCDPNIGLCRYDTYIYQNEVTKVVWKYNTANTQQNGNDPSKGDVIITRTGPDQAPTSAPSGTSASVNNLASQTANPATFTNVAPTEETYDYDNDTYTYNTSYKVSNVSGYTAKVGYCQYDRGNSPCVPNYFNPIDQADCTATTCTLGQNYYIRIDANKVTNMMVIYSPADTGDVIIKVTNADGTPAVGKSVGLLGYATTTANPATFSNVSTGDRNVFFPSAPAGYYVSVQACNYARGASPCAGGNVYDTTNYWTAGSFVCSEGYCYINSYEINRIYANRVTSIIVTYKPVDTGDMVIKRLAADGSLSASVTNVWLTGYATTTTNPATFTNVPTGQRNYYFPAPASGYYVSVQACTYARGGTPCAGGNVYDSNNYWTAGSFICSAGYCYVNSYEVNTISANSITNVSISYKPIGTATTGSNTGDILIKTVGSDLFTSSAPAGAQSKVDSGSYTSVNPNLVTNQTAASHTVYTTTVSNYSVSVGYCTYQRGTSECSVTSFNPATCTSTSCSYALNLSGYNNYVYKVAWKYDPTTSGNSTGDIQVKAVGEDLYTSSAPTGTSLSVDTLSATLTNPTTFTNLANGYTNHSVYASYNPSYVISVGSCTYARSAAECTVTSFTNVPVGTGNIYCDRNTTLCRYDVSVDSNKVTKVVWRYVYSNQNTTNPDGTSIDIRVKWVGTDLTTSTAPSGSIMSVDSFTPQVTNPITYKNLVTGSHQIYAKSVSGYKISFGYCMYARESSECAVANFVAASCDVGSGTCNLNINPGYGIEANKITKVVAKYDPIGTATSETSGTNINRGDVYIQHVGPEQTVASLPQGISIATWSDNGMATTTANPAIYNDLNPISEGWWGTYHYYVKNIPGYKITYGSCQYDRGTLPCFPTSINGDGWLTCTTTVCNLNNANNITANKVTKIVVVYTPTETGDLIVQHVGPDQTIASAPQGQQLAVWSEGVATSTANAAVINNLPPMSEGWWGTYHFYVKNIPGYTITYGSCKYQRGATPCTPNGYNGGYSWLECSTATCKLTQTDNIQALYVTKVVVVYTPTQTGDVSITRMGPGESILTDTYARMDGQITTNANPAVFTQVPITSTSTVFYVSKKAGYTIDSVYGCRYARNGVRCVPSAYYSEGVGYNSDCNSYGSMCQITVSSYNACSGSCFWVPGNVEANMVNQFYVRYVPDGSPEPDYNATTGDIKLKAVGNDLTTSSAPSTLQMNIDNSAFSSVNPQTKLNADPDSNHTVYTKYDPINDSVTVGYCDYVRGYPECTVSHFDVPTCNSTTGVCSTDTYVSRGYVKKLVWKFDSKNEGRFTGDTRIKRVGTDLYASSAPTSRSSYDNVSLSNGNPISYTNIKTGYHTYYSTYLPQTHITTVGSCTYKRGGAECAATNFSAATCDANTGLCSKQFEIQSDLVTKVVWKYDSIQTNSLTLTNDGDKGIAPGSTAISTVTATKNADFVNQNITWGISGLPTGANAIFSPSTCSGDCSTSVSISTSPTTPYGTYPIRVTANPAGIYTQFNLIVGNGTQIIVSNVVCDAEQYLPNWGDPDAVNRPIQINSQSAENFVNNSNGHCVLNPTSLDGSGWSYQWGYQQAAKSLGDYVGPLTTGTTLTSWRDFDQTAIGGQPASATIGDLRTSESIRIVVRENLKTDYVPFSAGVNVLPYDDVSAELFCNRDGVHYDNYEYIRESGQLPPVQGKTYYCVSFNALANPGANGDVIIYGIDSSGSTTDIPGSALQSKIKLNSTLPGVVTRSNLTENPALFTANKPGTYNITVADKALNSATPQVGICTYIRGGTECTVTEFNKTPATIDGITFPQIKPTCNGTTCSIQSSVSQGKVTKLVFKYSEETPPTLSCSVNPTNPRAKSTKVNWLAYGLSDPENYNFTWTGTDISGMTGQTIQKIYSTSGLKTGKVTATLKTDSSKVIESPECKVTVSLVSFIEI